MDDLRLNCDGVTIGSLVVPAFELRAGRLLSLQIPAPYDSFERLGLLDLLRGIVANPAIHLHSRAVMAEPADGRRGPLAAFFPLSAMQWLANHGHMPLSEANKLIRESGTCAPSDRVTRLAGTPRTVLGLLAAWGNDAETIIYSTSGLDPLGCQAVHRLVQNRLQECAALHLAYEHISNGERAFDCPPGAIMVRAEHAEQLAGPA